MNSPRANSMDGNVRWRPAGANKTVLTVLLAAVYVATGHLGFLLAIPPGNVTLLWPPSGIAMAAVLIFGFRAVPGIFIGAVIINGQAFYDGSSLNAQLMAISAAIAIGIGSALQPVLGRYLINRFGNLQDPFADGLTMLKSACLFAFACLVSSSIGSQTLVLFGFAQTSALDIFTTWWTGDFIGVLAFTALFLAIFTQTKTTAATLILATVISFGGTFFVSEQVRKSAEEIWDIRATREAERLTTTLVSWLETATSPVNSISALFESSNDVFEDEFIEATIRLEDFQPDFFPATMAIANAVANAQGNIDWEILYSTTETGPLSVGSIIKDGALISKAIQAALDEPGSLVLGEFAAFDQTQYAFAAVAVERQNFEQVVIGKIDLGQMFDGLFAVQVPNGFHVFAEGAGSADSPEDLKPVYTHGHVHETVLATKEIRGTSGNAQLTFNWSVTDAFLPGSRTGLPNAVLVGGILGSAILILFLTFIMGQNEKIRQRVRERTAELDRERTVLQATMEAMDQGLSMFDSNLVLTARNAKFMDMLDLPKDVFPVGAHIKEMLRHNAENGEYGDGDIDQMVDERVELASQFAPHRFERQRPDGTYLEIRGNPLPDGQGFVTTYTNITDRKHAEQEIASKQVALRMTLDNMPGGICMLDADLRIQVVNDLYCELYGHPPSVYRVGRPISEIIQLNVETGIHTSGTHVTDELQETVKQRIAAFRSGVSGESERILPNGRTLHVRHNPIEGGGIVLVVTDITDRKIAENLIATKQEQLTDIIENVQQAVILWDADKKPIIWNDNVADALSIDPKLLLDEDFDNHTLAEILANRGNYGDGDPKAEASKRLEKLWSGPARSEFSFDGERTFDVQSNVTPGGRLVITYTDITERIKTQMEIATKEAQLRAIIDNIPMVIILKDREGRHLTVNNHYEVATGLSSETVLGKKDEDFLPPEVAQGIRSIDQRAIESEKPYKFEELVPGPDGVLRNYLTTKVPVLNKDGDVDTLVIAALDITEQVEAQKEIAEKEAQLRMAMENMPGAMIVLNPDLDVILVNDSYKEFYGDPDNIVGPGVNMVDLLTSEAKRGILTGEGTPQEILDSRIKGYRDGIALNTVDRTDDGRHIQLMRKPIEGGYTISVAVDITELKTTERELANKEALLSAALENMSGGLFMIDADQNLRVFNDRLSEFYDIPISTLKIGDPLSKLLRVRAERGDYGPGDPEELLQKRLNSYRNRDIQIVMDYVNETIIEVYRAPMDDGGTVCVFNDVTERKRAEDELNKAHTLITESLTYASRIQRSLLPPKTILEEVFKDHCVIWEPTDMVGGDMVWLRPAEGGMYLIVADCTGHGPPGAFMTMICTGALDQSLAEVENADPADVLQRMNQKIKTALGQDGEHGESDDGVELGICHIDTKLQQITFAGARFSLTIVEKSQMSEIKGNKSAIGYRHVPSDIQFDNHTISYNSDMQFYMWTDGMVDQIGGPKRRSYGKRRLRKVILDYSQMDMSWQRSQILREFKDYQHTESRRDDITMVGFMP